MRKSILLLTVLAIFSTLFVSCGGSSSSAVVQPQPLPDNAPRVQVYVVRKSTDPTPDWVNKKWSIGKDESGNKVIYLTVEAERPTKEKAESELEGKKATVLASAFKERTTREYAIAKQGMLNDSSELDTYFEETIALLSRNVDTSGALPVEDYWEQLQEVSGSETKTYFRFVRKYQMSYDKFQKALNQSFEQVAKKIPPELKEKSEKVLDSLRNAE